MNAPKDWTQLVLDEGGRSLIEASAGTGKTWTIGVLYLRLLLEQKLSPRRIIVSTFTNAAAAELAERLRGRLNWALAEALTYHDNASEPPASPSPDSAWLQARWQKQPNSCAVDIRLLHAALAEFDAAPISTLHSLCTRILADHPFAAGALFRGREMIDGKSLETALADDLWRVISQGESHEKLVQLAQKAEITRNMLGKYVPVLIQPNVVVAPQDCDAIRQAVVDAIGDLPAWLDAVRTVFSTAGLVKRNRRIPKAWNALANALEGSSEDLVPVLSEYQHDLENAEDRGYVSNGGHGHALVDLLVSRSTTIARCVSPLSLDLAGSRPLRHFLAAAQQWCQHTMQARLETANQSTFDQLLYAVRDALAPHEGRRALADALFNAWPVALVDEFQDTDPVQFGILDTIYRDAAGQPRGRLLMIGDPKQAIYRFRGGDVEAYERARAAVPEQDRLTLDTNHRSSRAYVEAVNTFYAATGTRLGPPDTASAIEYQRVNASSRRDDEPLRNARTGEPISRPLIIHELPGGVIDATVELSALRACAGQIVWALSKEGYRIGDRALRPGDIAVLLPSHAQIRKLTALLKARGVPCVATSQTSVFDTDTARELRIVLHAVLHHDDPQTLRAALVTHLWGGSLAQIQALAHDAAAWDKVAQRFQQLHQTLIDAGPMAIINQLLSEHAQRLLDTVEGERILTDLRHLGELLQEARESVGNGERLMAWYADQMDDDNEDADAGDTRSLRLESDAERVKLMTLHASKGLEFGVVFLPLMWKHIRSKKAERSAALLSDPAGGQRWLVEEKGKEQVEQQELNERYRILYVALTRAIHACHVLALGPKTEKRPTEAPLNQLDLYALWQGDEGEAQAFVMRQSGWAAYPDAHWEPGHPATESRTARPLPAPPSGPIPQRHSFSSLITGQAAIGAEEEQAADDETPEDTPDFTSETPPAQTCPHPALNALADLQGTDFGNAVHAIFEHRQPGERLEKQQALIEQALKQHGVRPHRSAAQKATEAYIAPLTERLQAVLDTPLGSADGPRLMALSAHEMRAEMEFNYVLDGVSLRELRRVCVKHGEPALIPPRDQTLAGLMNGKIDLVFAHGGRFHVLDYKSNTLSPKEAPCLSGYNPEALETAMQNNHYRFQALLYVIAVERYLRERLGTSYRRDQHLGDAWYLFIRATGLSLPDGTPCGVWRHRFDDGLLDDVQAVLGSPLLEVA